MEPFRAIIADSVVLTAVNTGEVGPSDFVVAVTGTALTQAGRRRFVEVFERRLSQETTHPVFGYQVSMRRMLLVFGTAGKARVATVREKSTNRCR